MFGEGVPRSSDLVSRGIYRLEGDTLELCQAFPDESRPTEFATRKGDTRLLMVLKRVGPKTQ